MRRHVFSECSDFLREFLAGFFAQPMDPFDQCVAGGGVKPRDFFFSKFLRQLYRRQSRIPKNFVRVSIADAAEESRIGERPFQRVRVRGG